MPSARRATMHPMTDINQRNVFGSNMVARLVVLGSPAERLGFAKGFAAAVLAGLFLHIVFGIG
jgi:hypothetical protein